MDSRFGGNDTESAVKHGPGRRVTVLPALALERRGVVGGKRIADAEMADEGPGRRYVENGGNPRRIEDRDPAHADPFGARGEPERMNRVDHRIIERLWHRQAAEPLPLRRAVVGEHGDLARR